MSSLRTSLTLIRRVALSAALLCLLTPGVWAQGEEVGSIEEMKRGEMTVEATADVRLTATPAYIQKPARQRDALHIRELVEVLQPVYVRAHLDYRGLDTRIVAGSSGARVGAVELQRRGAYEILADRVDPLSGLELRIRHGVIAIEHAAGRLGIWVKETFMTPNSTVLFAVDSTSASSLVYLYEGSLAFPDHDFVIEEDRSAWQIRDGVLPERLLLQAAALRQLQRETDFLARDLWVGSTTPSSPFYTKPAFYLPVGVAVVGAVAFVAVCGTDFDCSDDGPAGRYAGTVTVRIP